MINTYISKTITVTYVQYRVNHDEWRLFSPPLTGWDHIPVWPIKTSTRSFHRRSCYNLFWEWFFSSRRCVVLEALIVRPGTSAISRADIWELACNPFTAGCANLSHWTSFVCQEFRFASLTGFRLVFNLILWMTSLVARWSPGWNQILVYISLRHRPNYKRS